MKSSILLDSLTARKIPASYAPDSDVITVHAPASFVPLVFEEDDGIYIDKESLDVSDEVLLSVHMNSEGSVIHIGNESEDEYIPSSLAEADVNTVADRLLTFHDLLNPDDGQAIDAREIAAFWGLPVR